MGVSHIAPASFNCYGWLLLMMELRRENRERSCGSGASIVPTCRPLFANSLSQWQERHTMRTTKRSEPQIRVRTLRME